ncbi:MAG: universal stress protein, partial [Planctomycetota bacterium]
MRILLAYDNSQQSKNALEFASQLPLRKPVDFEIASIVAPPVFVDSMVTGFPLDLGPFIDAETSEARTEVDEVGAKLERRDHVHSVHGRVVVGPPTSRLLDIAEQCKADLVVLGAVGHSAVQRVLLGSVSDYVATHSDTST